MKIWLTMGELRVRFRDELGLHFGPETIHKMKKQGMPFRDFGKRSKFCWPKVLAWIEEDQDQDSTITQVRDSLFRRRLGKARR